MTLCELFREGEKRGIIDWTLRADTLNGMPKFYIHASMKDSATLDFAVDIDAFGKEFLVPKASNADAAWSPVKGGKPVGED